MYLQCGRPRFNPWVGKIPWRRQWQPTPVLLPGESHGGRSLVGYSPWGRRVGHDWATSLSLSVLFEYHSVYGGLDGKASAYNAGDPGSIPGLGRSPGEGNGNPLQYSCLKNPMDGGAWLATVHGVEKSRTRLSDFIFTFTFTVHAAMWTFSCIV